VELNATFLIQLALVCLLLVWLTPMLFEPFMRLFEERERRIVGASADAKKLAGSAEERTAMIAQKTSEAQAEARKVLTSFRDQAAIKEAEIIQAARDHASQRIDEARSDLFDATEEARRSLKDDAKALSGAIVEKVLGRTA